MKVTVYVQMMNVERGDYQEVEVELGQRHRWKPNFMGMSIGWRHRTPEELIWEAGEDAERFINERRPGGTWIVAGFLNPDDLSGTEDNRAAQLWGKLEELEAAS